MLWLLVLDPAVLHPRWFLPFSTDSYETEMYVKGQRSDQVQSGLCSSQDQSLLMVALYFCSEYWANEAMAACQAASLGSEPIKAGMFWNVLLL